MLELLLAIVAMILIGMFWRIILPVALVSVSAIVLFILGAGMLIEHQNNIIDQEKKVAFTCPDPQWANYPIIETPEQKPYIAWAKKNCPGPILSVPLER